MENNFILNNFNSNIEIRIGIKPKYYAYFLLIITSFLLFLPFLFQYNTTFENVLLTFIYLILIIFLPLKYAVWNVVGKEILIINKKSISFSYNFGFISTNLKTTSFTDLSINFEDLLIEKEQTFGKIYFYEFATETGLPKLIHNTSIHISEENFQAFLVEIDHIFRYSTFSEN